MVIPTDINAIAAAKDLGTIQLRLFEVNPPSESDLADLRAQRIACGWKVETIPQWVKEVQEGHRLMWFICEKAQESSHTMESIGMISLNLYDPEDPSIANLRAPDAQRGDRVEISLLFVYPKHSGKGVGGQAIRYLEDLGREMGARVVTMNTAIGTHILEWYKGKLGYKECRPREKRYLIEVVRALGMPDECVYAAFLEKGLGASDE
jgi:GNAT superfamily N-acetyltransferase